MKHEIRRGRVDSSIYQFSSDIYELRERLAMKEKVPLAWIVHDAIERYINEEKERLARN